MSGLDENSVLELYCQMAKAISSRTGQDYLNSLCTHIADTFGSKIVVIGLVDESGDNITTSSLVVDGNIKDNITYPLKHTPYNDLITQSVCVHPENVCNKYLQDEFLQKYSIESYAGAPLLSDSSVAIGLIAILDDKKIVEATKYFTFVDLVSMRASTEINRMRLTDELREQNRKFKALVKCSSDITWELDASYNICFISESVSEILGYQPDELIGRNISKYIRMPPGKKQLDFLAHQDAKDLVVTVSNHSSQIVFLESNYIRLFDTEGTLTGFRGLSSDITQRVSSEKRLALADTIVENVAEAIMVTDTDNLIIRVNGAFCDITGYSSEEVIGKKPSLLKSGRHNDEFYVAFYHQLERTGGWRGEIWNRRKSGEIYPQWVSISSLHDNSGVFWGRVSLFNDLSLKKEFDREMEYQATHDSLTNLSNRRNLLDAIGQEICRTERTMAPFAVIYIDIDHFKSINDTWGHSVGDQLLTILASRITDSIRQTDLAARIGGDEFAVVLSNLKEKQLAFDIEYVAGKILSSISQPCAIDGIELVMSASLGATVFPFGGKDTSELLKNADAAMLEAKRAGKNRFRLYTSETNLQQKRQIKVRELILDALELNELYINYQPVCDLEADNIALLKVNVRWQSEELGDVNPQEFLSVAAELGQSANIDLWSIEYACRALSTLRLNQHNKIKIIVPVSEQSLSNVNVIDQILAVLDQYQIEPSSFCIEVAEGDIKVAGHIGYEILSKLRSHGVQLSLSSVGERAYTLDLLYQLPVDILTINERFVRDLVRNEKSMHIVKALLTLGRGMGCQVVAEGVESKQHAFLLKNIGCMYQQGDYIDECIDMKGTIGI